MGATIPQRTKLIDTTHRTRTRPSSPRRRRARGSAVQLLANRATQTFLLVVIPAEAGIQFRRSFIRSSNPKNKKPPPAGPKGALMFSTPEISDAQTLGTTLPSQCGQAF
jgi:hypothetical protein